MRAVDEGKGCLAVELGWGVGTDTEIFVSQILKYFILHSDLLGTLKTLMFSMLV